MDVSTLQAAVDSLRVDIDTILEARVPESEAPFVEPAEDTVLAALFATSEIQPPPPQENAKRRRDRVEDEARARKKERGEMEAARRASLAEEEAQQMRASELAAGVSSSCTVEIAGGTTDSAVVAKDTMLASLFATFDIPPPPPSESAKRHRGRAEDKVRARKKERGEMEAARRASLAEEEAHQMRASELAAGASCS